MAGRLPFPYPSVFDANGNPLSGAKLNFYQSGTSTPLNTFSDAALSIPNANPVVADSSGRFSDIFLGDGPYKVVLSTSAAVVQWTADPVYAPSNVSGLAFDLPTVGGTANAVTLTYTRPPVALTAGLKLPFKATAANTGAAQVNVNGLGLKNIFRQSGANAVALTGGEIQAGQIVEIEYDGTQFQLITQMPGLYLIKTKDGAGLSSLGFTSSLDNTFDEYLFVISNLLPATDGTDLYCRVSQDGGATYKAGATDYRWANFVSSDAATNASTGSAGAPVIKLAIGFSNIAGHVGSGEVRLYGPSLGNVIKPISSRFDLFGTGATYSSQFGGGMYTPDGNAITAIQFFFSSGNIASGTFGMYGLRK